MHSSTRSPKAADEVLASGKLDGVLTADDEQFYWDTIKSERVLREREAHLTQQQHAEKLRADGAVATERAFKAARDTGRYDLADRTLIIKANPKDYPEILAALNRARTIGRDTAIIPAQTAAEDQELLRTIEIDWRAKPHDDLRTEQLQEHPGAAPDQAGGAQKQSGSVRQAMGCPRCRRVGRRSRRSSRPRPPAQDQGALAPSACWRAA